MNGRSTSGFVTDLLLGRAPSACRSLRRRCSPSVAPVRDRLGEDRRNCQVARTIQQARGGSIIHTGGGGGKPPPAVTRRATAANAARVGPPSAAPRRQGRRRAPAPTPAA